ncbi:hypothetical protein ACXO5N_004152, partial [Escherichia coli]
EPQNTIIWIADKVVIVHAVSGTVASLKSSPLLAITFLYHQNDLSEKSTQMWTGNDKYCHHMSSSLVSMTSFFL